MYLVILVVSYASVFILVVIERIRIFFLSKVSEKLKQVRLYSKHFKTQSKWNHNRENPTWRRSSAASRKSARSWRSWKWRRSRCTTSWRTISAWPRTLRRTRGRGWKLSKSCRIICTRWNVFCLNHFVL